MKLERVWIFYIVALLSFALLILWVLYTCLNENKKKRERMLLRLATASGQTNFNHPVEYYAPASNNDTFQNPDLAVVHPAHTGYPSVGVDPTSTDNNAPPPSYNDLFPKQEVASANSTLI